MTPKKFILSAFILLLFFSCSNDDNTVANTAPVVSNQTVSTSENILDTDIIYQVNANDADGDSLEFTLDANSDALFELSSTGALSLATGKTLSFATKTQHVLTISVTDGVDKNTATLTVNVTENESPTFSQESYEFSKPEDIPDTEIIGTVVVMDLDNPEMLEFTLNDNGDFLFEIDNDGQISLLEGQSLDFENKEKHTLEISVSDGLITSITQVGISVENVPDTLAEQPESFITTWEIPVPDFELTLTVDDGNFQYNYTIDWGDGTVEEVTGGTTHVYQEPDTYTVAIQGNFPAIFMGLGESDSKNALKSIEQWGAIVWESMNGAFDGCPNLEYNAEDMPDLSVVQDMSFMFKDTSALNANLGDWNISNVTDMTGMFDNSGMSTNNYSSTLVGWSEQNVQNGVTLGAEGINTNCDGQTAKGILEGISQWNINDAGLDQLAICL
ncbi:BspA family leucine-rich repeat surface protein [Flagellimonas meridianipacifica]|uniref:Surface protein n=1 Tax=Flagellimonas meridianipacifica TaxID=1080225 RepID=A0A2T0MAH4_9FLAO|nr:BspA family leucine-rich repeat surface protein [Allomuricauda pacifica]PRX54501.1 surface protein [Allomuricauda pacifica]